MRMIEYLGAPGAALSPDDIDEMIARAADNGQFRALLHGVKHLGIKLQCILPDDSPEPIVKPPAHTVIVVDDGDVTRSCLGVSVGGPDGFHQPSLDALIRTASAVVVNGSDPVEMPGALAALDAHLFGLAVLIDTDGENFPAWVERVLGARGTMTGVLLAGDPETLPPRIRSKTLTVGSLG